MVTSLTPQMPLMSCFPIFNTQFCDMKYTMPAAIACGILSVIIFCCSIFFATNLDSIVNSVLKLSRLQYRSMKELGVVIPKSACCDGSMFRSILCRIFTAMEQPLVALVLSSLKISAISCAVRGQPFNRHEI